MKPHVPAADRLIARIAVDDNGCWNYPTLNDGGYGVIGRGHRSAGTLRTHRVMYELLIGPIPAGLVLDHLCRNRACCNPDHLEPVTQAENNARGIRKSAQTHCAKGHALSGDNLRETARQRICRTCERIRSREYQQRKRAAMKGETA